MHPDILAGLATIKRLHNSKKESILNSYSKFYLKVAVTLNENDQEIKDLKELLAECLEQLQKDRDIIKAQEDLIKILAQ